MVTNTRPAIAGVDWKMEDAYDVYVLYIYTYIHTYIHTYMHTYIHTYIHTYMHTRAVVQCGPVAVLNYSYRSVIGFFAHRLYSFSSGVSYPECLSWLRNM